MKPKQPDEFEEFDKIMGGLLSVPYSELRKKLEEEEKRQRRNKKRGELLLRLPPALLHSARSELNGSLREVS